MIVRSIIIRAIVLNENSHEEELWEMRRAPNEMTFIERWSIDVQKEKSALINGYAGIIIPENEFTPVFLKGFIQGTAKR